MVSTPKDPVDWATAPEWAKHLIIQPGGIGWWTENQPYPREGNAGYWDVAGGRTVRLSNHIEFDRECHGRSFPKPRMTPTYKPAPSDYPEANSW